MQATAAEPNTAAHAGLREEGDTLVLALEGDWLLTQSRPHFAKVVQEPLAARGATREVTFDTAQLGSWDSSLLIFIVQCQDYCEAQGLTMRTDGLPEQVPRLLTLVHAVPERSQPKAPAPATFLSRLGSAGVRQWDDTRKSLAFLGEIAISLMGLVGRRVHMRWREFWVVVQTNSSGALPIVTLIALLMGIIIAFLGVVVLQRFGAGYYVSYLAGFGMLREMGALMTGIIIAGRTGAAFAAELGSMKITEEIDAFTTLGISPIEHLVLPRILGLFIMMPLLTNYADFVGIAGGMIVSGFMLDLSFKQFMSGLLDAVTISDALLGVFKGMVFGFIVGVAGCMKGLQAGSDASAVGKAATSAVVLGITLIITANAVIDWLAALLNV